MDEEKSIYINTAKLVKKTAKIETILEQLGGVGGGIYDKADSTKKFSKEFMTKLIKIAEIRNNAVHGNPIIPNFDMVMEDTEKLLKIVQKEKIKLFMLKLSIPMVILIFLCYLLWNN